MTGSTSNLERVEYEAYNLIRISNGDSNQHKERKIDTHFTCEPLFCLAIRGQAKLQSYNQSKTFSILLQLDVDVKLAVLHVILQHNTLGTREDFVSFHNP